MSCMPKWKRLEPPSSSNPMMVRSGAPSSLLIPMDTGLRPTRTPGTAFLWAAGSSARHETSRNFPIGSRRVAHRRGNDASKCKGQGATQASPPPSSPLPPLRVWRSLPLRAPLQQKFGMAHASSRLALNSHLRNSQWRRSSTRSLPPIWYQPLSQRKATISSVLKPHQDVRGWSRRRGFPAGRQADGRSVLPGLVFSACAILMGEVPNICYTVLELVCLELFGEEHEQREPGYCSRRR